MPGHKGKTLLGPEKMDITEIYGADSLYDAEGIIAQSEENAGRIFNARTFYSTEGSSQCIRAMVYLALLGAAEKGETLKIAAGRNAHKTFLSACAMLDLDPFWIWPKNGCYLSCEIGAEDIDALPDEINAVYITSPDYLGNILDIASIAKKCHERGMILLVDNAHGAYLKFLPGSLHPMDLGADICCDSAHKTLPALTGAAYLHINKAVPAFYAENAKSALAMFGSTSPSYLILQSLDAVNRYISEDFPEKLKATAVRVVEFKSRIAGLGYRIRGSEPMKLCVEAKPFGYTGPELASLLRERGLECEFADPDFLVLMFSTENTPEEFAALEAAFADIPKRAEIKENSPIPCRKEKVITPRIAELSARESVAAADASGRILAHASFGCPPAVPFIVCGELIDRNTIDCFKYYGIEKCSVVK